MSYEAATGLCRIWDSKNDQITEDTKETFSDLDAEGNLRLGAVCPSDAFSNYFQGMIGEVRIWNAALSDWEFKLQRQSLVSKWTAD